DEPTNHLDALTRDALAQSLAAFQGALLLVSHDRYLLRACVDSLWILRDQKLEAFDGDISDYELDLLHRKRHATAEIEQPQSGSHRSKQQQRQHAARQREQLKAALKPIDQAIKHCDANMESLRQSIAECDRRLGELPGKDPTAWQQAAKTRAHCERLLQEQEDIWIDLAMQRENCEKTFLASEAEQT
ncbi:MAG: hypothetical protein EBZ01_03550, partial [Betaproteobacteria bacterium]|nr:hypothetical protein [Betaproteobacteria bacterium]